jgi:hypothetical protein
MDSYTVTRHKHGIVVTGHVPMQDMIALLKVWENMRMGNERLAKKLGATIVALESEQAGVCWAEELGIGPERE